MKKIYLFIAVLVSVFLLSSCGNASKEPVETQTQLLDTEASVPSDSLFEDYSGDPIPLQATSIDDLVSEIEGVKSGKDISSGIDVSQIDKLIVPDFNIEGYTLWHASVGHCYFEYCYVPISKKIENNMQVDYDKHIVIYIAWPPYEPNRDDPLQSLVGQDGGYINEDGYIHLSHKRDIAFAYEQTWASVRYPTALTYDEAKQLCKLKTINID